MQARLAVDALLIVLRLVNFFEFSARGVFNNQRPGLVRFAERHCVGITRSAVATDRFIGTLRNVRTAHDDRHARGANRTGNAISFRNHPRHRPNPDKPDLVLLHELYDLIVGHRLGVAVNQNHFMTGRRECLQQKHPEMRHEVSRHTVIRVIE